MIDILQITLPQRSLELYKCFLNDASTAWFLLHGDKANRWRLPGLFHQSKEHNHGLVCMLPFHTRIKSGKCLK
jgi:hypothetical protein